MDRSVYFVLCTLMSFLIVGCKQHVGISTIVHPDMSLERYITTAGDSAGVNETAFPFPQDSLWHVSKIPPDTLPDDSTLVLQRFPMSYLIAAKNSADSTTILYSTHRHFPNADSMNAVFYHPKDTIRINVSTKVEKRFRWFYTFYRYSETYHGYNPFRLVPLSDLMTEKEIKFLQTGQDSVDVEDKLEKWHQQNFFEAYYRVLKNNIATLQPDINTEQLKAKKDALFEAFSNQDFLEEETTVSMLQNWQEILGTKVVWTLEEQFHEVTQKVEQYFTFIINKNDDFYYSQVVMPGQIFDGNAIKVNGRYGEWRIDSDDLAVFEKEIWCEARKWNVLPSAVTAVFVLIVIMFLIITRKNNGRRI